MVSNARARWSAVQFEIRRVTVQGPRAVPEVSAAIAELDRDPRVEVIVVARGGGSFEDLLPFSNESLVRVAAACRTPLVSAIGHHLDTPLLDLVADLRASTPTDAAKRIVPDVSEERARVTQARLRARAALTARLTREQTGLDHWRSRPVLANPTTLVDLHEHRVTALRDSARRSLHTALVHGRGGGGRARGAGPGAVAGRDARPRVRRGAARRRARGARPGRGGRRATPLRIRVARGELAARVTA